MGSISKRWGWAVLPPMLLLFGVAGATVARAAQPSDKISRPVDDAETVAFHGQVRPEVAAAQTLGSPEQDLLMEHMILTLKADAAQEAALTKLIQDQQDPHSASYHKFLTPQQYGAQFGASANDVTKLTAWLTDHGFTVEQVPAGHRSIVFSGTAGLVTSTFGTTIRKLTVGGEVHYANAEEPRIPAALSELVGGFVKLNDFHHKPTLVRVQSVPQDAASAPQFNYGSSHYLAPADYATIYDLNSLYSAKIDGTGQSIAIVARSNISLSDLATFRSEFGLPANNPTVIIASGTDPGFVSGDGDEATLDAQWSGAVAPKATVKLVVASSTATADGVDLSAQYIVNNNIAPVMSVSFGSCEAGMGSGGVAFYNSLWQQAAAEGITVMISSGDSGAAGCYYGGSSSGSGRAVNGLCTSSYDVCVGGTEFAEGNNPGQYWLSGNNAVMGSAQSYIPETVWNESGSNSGSGLWAGGGGASIYISKPSWQTGPGVPADGARDVPDVSLTAAGHDGYIIEEHGSMYVIAGTSASSPSFAGIMALVTQKLGTRVGNPNTTLYKLASLQAAGGAKVFHDITTGSNTVPGVTGFTAGVGYDQGSGLGSVDAALLINHWTDVSSAPALNAVNSPTTLSVNTGATATFTTAVTAMGSFKSAVTLAASGAPAGVTLTLSATSLASPGSGSVTASVVASKSAIAGTYTITITATGGGLTATAATALTIVSPSFTLTPSASAATVSTALNASVPVSIAPSGGFNSTVTLSVSSAPAGVTASFSPTTISGTVAASSTLTMTASQSAKAGTYPLTITAVGGGITKTASFSLTVIAPSFQLSASTSSATVLIGGSAPVGLSIAPSGGFNSLVTLTATGLPAGLTAVFSPASVSGTATSTSALTLSASTAAKAGTYAISINAGGGGLSRTVALSLTVPAPTFTVSTTTPAPTLPFAGTGAVPLTYAPSNGFNSAVSLTATGLPAGMTASFSPVSLSGSAAATSTLTLAAAATVKAATYPITVTATGGGITKTLSLSVTVTPQLTLTVTAAPASLSVPRGGSGQSVIMTSVTGPFTSAITLSASGMPAGVQASFNSTTIAAGAGNVLTLAVANTVPLGTYSITVTAAGQGLTKAVTVQLTVQPQLAFTLGLSNQFITVKAGGPAVTVNMLLGSISAGFNSPVSLMVTGTQANISQKFAASTLTPAAPSTGLTVSASSNASPGIYTIWFAGYTASLTQSIGLSVTVTH